MMMTTTEETARKFAAERNLEYGFSTFSAGWIVGTREELKAAGVVDPIVAGLQTGDIVNVCEAFRMRDDGQRGGTRTADGLEGRWTIVEVTADGRDAKALRGGLPTTIASQCRIDNEYDAFIPLARCTKIDRIG